MNSFLISGGTQEQQEKKIKQIQKKIFGKFLPLEKSHPDVYWVGGRGDPVWSPVSIGINQIRELKTWLSKKPFQSSFKIAIINKGETMTSEAQNAFLKSLEEPPKNTLIFLLTSLAPQNLLPTILSRCQIIKLPITNYQLLITNYQSDDRLSFLKTLIDSKPGKQLQLIEPYTKTREEAINFCQNIIVSLRQEALTMKQGNNETMKQCRILQKFQKALNLLQKNINQKLVLDNLVLEL